MYVCTKMYFLYKIPRLPVVPLIPILPLHSVIRVNTVPEEETLVVSKICQNPAFCFSLYIVPFLTLSRWVFSGNLLSYMLQKTSQYLGFISLFDIFTSVGCISFSLVELYHGEISSPLKKRKISFFRQSLDSRVWS